MITRAQLEEGNLVLRRTYAAGMDDVWAAITQSDRLARWYGTWTGDPESGSVMVTMNAEAEEVAPARYDITECDAPRRLSLTVGEADVRWRLDIELNGSDGATTLTFVQQDIDPDLATDMGAGWGWYLDRLGAGIDGTTPPTLDDFESTYLGA
ncbi:MAG: SRPBCC domain-containing protein [Candidatus Microthrix parvicella]